MSMFTASYGTLWFLLNENDKQKTNNSVKEIKLEKYKLYILKEKQDTAKSKTMVMIV